MNFQQSLETLQFQRSQFKSRNTPRGIACEIGEAGSEGGGRVRAATHEPPDWRPPRGLRGLARLRDDAPNQTSATQAPLAWRAPEGPEGTGGLRDRPLRAKLACGDLAGGRARRRPEHPWGHQQQRAARTARGRAAAHGHTKQPGPTKHTRRPEHQRHHKQRRKSGGRSNAENQVE